MSFFTLFNPSYAKQTCAVYCEYQSIIAIDMFHHMGLESFLKADCRAVLLSQLPTVQYSQLHARGDNLGFLEGLRTLRGKQQSGENSTPAPAAKNVEHLSLLADFTAMQWPQLSRDTMCLLICFSSTVLPSLHT